MNVIPIKRRPSGKPVFALGDPVPPRKPVFDFGDPVPDALKPFLDEVARMLAADFLKRQPGKKA